jgi:hypothetical protein
MEGSRGREQTLRDDVVSTRTDDRYRQSRTPNTGIHPQLNRRQMRVLRLTFGDSASNPRRVLERRGRTRSLKPCALTSRYGCRDERLAIGSIDSVPADLLRDRSTVAARDERAHTEPRGSVAAGGSRIGGENGRETAAWPEKSVPGASTCVRRYETVTGSLIVRYASSSVGFSGGSSSKRNNTNRRSSPVRVGSTSKLCSCVSPS